MMTSEQLFEEIDQSSELATEVDTEPKKKGKKGAKALFQLPVIQHEDVGTIAHPLKLGLLLQVKEPITHMNPGSGDKSNFSRFRREPMLRARPVAAEDVIATTVQRLRSQFPVPAEMIADFETMTPSQYIAAVIVRVCYDLCYYWDSDRSRMCYGMLHEKPTDAGKLWQGVAFRLQQCATDKKSAREYIGALLSSVQVKTISSNMDASLSAVYALPQSAVELAMVEITDNAALTQSDARRWYISERLARTEQRELVTLPAVELPPSPVSGMETVWVPEVSGVSVRHHIRAGCVRHLLRHLGVGMTDKVFSPEIERMLQNGGALTMGSQMATSDRIMATRMTFPMLDLLGGCLPDAMLGSSQLLLSVPRLVCRETASILPESVQALPQATAPAESMMGSRSYARAAMLGESDGMPYGREVILEGAAIYVGMRLRPYTSLLTLGALICGVNDWLENAPGIGGAQASGFGMIEGEWLTDDSSLMDRAVNCYQHYLTTNREGLLQRLLSGRIDEA